MERPELLAHHRQDTGEHQGWRDDELASISGFASPRSNDLLPAEGLRAVQTAWIPETRAGASRRVACWIRLYEIKGAAPPLSTGRLKRLTAETPRSPALARLRAPPPLTGHASREPGSRLSNLTRQLTSEPPTRRRSIRPTRGRVKGAYGVAARWPTATPDPTTFSVELFVLRYGFGGRFCPPDGSLRRPRLLHVLPTSEGSHVSSVELEPSTRSRGDHRSERASTSSRPPRGRQSRSRARP